MIKLKLIYQGDKYAKVKSFPLLTTCDANEGVKTLIDMLKTNYKELIVNLGDSSFIYFSICQKNKNPVSKKFKGKYRYDIIYSGRINETKVIYINELTGDIFNGERI